MSLPSPFCDVFCLPTILRRILSLPSNLHSILSVTHFATCRSNFFQLFPRRQLLSSSVKKEGSCQGQCSILWNFPTGMSCRLCLVLPFSSVRLLFCVVLAVFCVLCVSCISLRQDTMSEEKKVQTRLKNTYYRTRLDTKTSQDTRTQDLTGGDTTGQETT
jgi:hypothetical protein